MFKINEIVLYRMKLLSLILVAFRPLGSYCCFPYDNSFCGRKVQIPNANSANKCWCALPLAFKTLNWATKKNVTICIDYLMGKD